MEKIIVGDHLLHESCFVCEKCNSRLTTGNYEEIDGDYYCFKDAHAVKREKNIKKNTEPTSPRTTGKMCPLCKKRVFSAEGVVLDNEDLVHRSCFVCTECKTPLSLGNFHTIDEKFFCTRHFFQRGNSDANINGRKKARDLFAGSLDADPLQQAFTDLEKQEKKLEGSNTKPTETSDHAEPETKTDPPEPQTNKDTETPTQKDDIVPKLEDKPTENRNDGESDDASRDPDTARSVSVSETDYLDLTEEDEKESGKESDMNTTASEKSEGNTSKIKHPGDGTEEAEPSKPSPVSKPITKETKKKSGRKDDDKDKKKSKKKRKSEKSK